MRRLIAALVIAGAVAFGPTGAADTGAEFKLIVHESNSTKLLVRSQVSRMFLKKLDKWPDGGKDYWRKLVFAGRQVPPPEADSDAKVPEYVAEHPRSLGYVSATAELGSGLHEVELR